MVSQGKQEEALVGVICQNAKCGKFFSTEQKNRGREVTCPKCRSRMLIGKKQNDRTVLVGGEI